MIILYMKNIKFRDRRFSLIFLKYILVVLVKKNIEIFSLQINIKSFKIEILKTSLKIKLNFRN